MGQVVSNAGGMQFVEGGVNVLGFTMSDASACRHEQVEIGKFADTAARAAANAVIAATASGFTAFASALTSYLSTAHQAVWSGWSTSEQEDCFAIADFYRVKGWSF